MGKKSKKRTQLKNIHPELKGFDMYFNEFGEIVSTLPIDRVNKFLTDKVYDKKLKNDIE